MSHLYVFLVLLKPKNEVVMYLHLVMKSCILLCDNILCWFFSFKS